MRHLSMTIACLVLMGSVVSPGVAAPQWLMLPPTPTLPQTERSGYAPVDGIRIWYATFGRGSPVILLHGGLANADYWGHQVRALAPRYRVIVMDSRCQGRSTCNDAPISYALMAADVLGLMDFLSIRKAAVVGWSDGAIVGLEIALHHPERITKLFAFAANSNPAGVQDVSKSPVFEAYIARARREYERLSPTPTQFPALLARITQMWARQPKFTAAQLRRIRVPTWIVDGDHDEAIKRSDTLFLADHISGSGLLIEPDVSHFAFLQDPIEFDASLLHFLAHVNGQAPSPDSSSAEDFGYPPGFEQHRSVCQRPLRRCSRLADPFVRNSGQWKLPAYSLANLRFGLKGLGNNGDTWTASLFVNNLTNNAVLLDPQPQEALQTEAYTRFTMTQPLTAGIAVTYNFH
jgi:pimeloyl-ACP methyl ester carboxylesterase